MTVIRNTHTNQTFKIAPSRASTTLIRNLYFDGVFQSTEIIGTFADYRDAEEFLNDKVLYNGQYEQIAPCGYERKDQNGERLEHIIVAGSNNRERDINGRWTTSL